MSNTFFQGGEKFCGGDFAPPGYGPVLNTRINSFDVKF